MKPTTGELTDAPSAADEHPPGRAERVAPSRPRRGPFSPFVAVVGVIVVAWLVHFVLPKYIELDQKRVGIRLLPTFSWHYPILIVHVAGATIAMLTGVLQMWPWLRQTRPAVHRMVGRLYALAVLFAAPAALTLVFVALKRDGMQGGTYLSSFTIGNVIWAFLWFGTTARGFQLARLRRFAEHRRMMIYSYALTLAIMYSRVFIILAQHNTIKYFNLPAFYNNVGWLPWVVNLLVAQWWINRTARKPLVIADSSAAAAGIR